MSHSSLRLAFFLGNIALAVQAQTPGVLPKPPLLHDPALKIEALATYPDIETPASVAAAPDGSFFVGNDPRDSRLNTKNPECTIVRYSSMGADRKRTVFAESLYSPAGMCWHEGWLYVMHDPLLTRFQDTDGDGVADVREDLVTDIGNPPQEGMNDHNVSGFVLGLDGRFYISVGDRGIYQAKGRDGSTITLQGGGIARMRPDGTGLEIFSTGTRNHLQVALDAEDNAFTLDNTDDGNGWWTRLTHHIAGGFYGYPFEYQKAPNFGVIQPSAQTLDAVKRNGSADVKAGSSVEGGLSMVDGKFSGPSTTHSPPSTSPLPFLPAMADFGGGSPTGALAYLSDGLPEKYRGQLFFSEWGQRRISVIEVAREGAAFRFVKNEPLLQEDKGSDFRPLQMSVANDGSLLIADWGFGGWKAPRKVGTLWRVSWPDAKPAPRLAEEKSASLETLLAALGHPDRDQRLRAQFALREKGEAAEPKVIALMLDAHAPRVQRIQAMWALASVEAPLSYGFTRPGGARGALQKCFTDPDAVLRAQALKVIASKGLTFPPAVITACLKDADAPVRLHAIEAMAGIWEKSALSSERSQADYAESFTAALLPVLADPDAWLNFSARAALKKMANWPAIFKACKTADAKTREQLWLILDGVFDEEVVAFLVEAVKSADADVRARAASALGSVAYRPKPWDGVWWHTQPVKNPPAPSDIAWAGTPDATTALSAALADSDARVRLAAAQALARSLGAEALPALRAQLPAETDPAVRRQLIETLGIQKDPEALSLFSGIALDEKADPAFRDAAIGAVASIGGEGAKQTIAQLAAAKLSGAATRKVITAAGEYKVLEAAPALIAHLQDENTGNRLAAAKALGQLGPKSHAAPALIAHLQDTGNDIQRTVIDALAGIRDPSVLPQLLEFGSAGKQRKWVLGAVAAMPDPSSIPFLIETLNDPGSSSFRRPTLAALVGLRAASWPAIEQAIASGKIRAELVPEIKAAFDSGVIVKWKIAGPFENVWGASHPPEDDALAAGDFLSKKYLNAVGKNAGWEDVSGDAERGWVSLDQLFHNTGMLCAYAFAEITSPAEADARLLCGSNDQIAIWLNGKKAHDFGGTRPFVADSDEVPIHFIAGKNRLLVKIGNASGPWEFAVRIPGLDGTKFTPAAELPPDVKQRNFALATKADGTWQHPGDPVSGGKIFHDASGPIGGICAQCHIVGGKGGNVGPDLSAIASNYKRADLIVSIHEPSKTIALGFDQFAVETKGGDVFAGAIRKETDDELTVLGVDQQPHVVKKSDVKMRTALPTSIMPQGLTLGLTPDQFTDLLAYLETLKGQ